MVARHGSSLEKDVLSALQGVGKTKLVDGFLRQLWQEYHEHYFDVSGIGVSINIEAVSRRDPILAKLNLTGGGEAQTIFLKAFQQLTQLQVFVFACDPPLKFDAQEIGAKLPYDASTCQVLDGSMKAGKPCIVLLPALRGADNLVKVKSTVLPAD